VVAWCLEVIVLFVGGGGYRRPAENRGSKKQKGWEKCDRKMTSKDKGKIALKTKKAE
jgi:hypothetical protein